MKVLLLLMITTLVVAVRGEYRYKIRGPPPPPPKPLPPRPPVPSHFLSSKPSHGHVFFSKGKIPSHRVVTRPHLHAVPHFHTLVPRPVHTVPIGPQGHHFKSPNTLLLSSATWKGDAFSLGHNFRAPSVKESFLPSPPADFDFQPPKPQPAPPTPLTTHITNSLDDDDDKGPIHTIPAPNLGPTGNHHHHHFHQQRHQIQQKPQNSFLEIEKVPIAHVGTNTLALHQPHTHTYEVHEPSNDHAVRTPDGHTTYFAPDPDPSLPAPKVPATMDPHSLPSNGRIPPPELLPQTPIGLQVLDTNGGLGVTGNSLSSQELVELLNHQPNQSPQVLDTFNVGVPQLQQHFLQTSSVYSPSSAHFLTPEFQTFNYEEQHQPHQQSEASENIPTVIKNVPVHFHSYEAKANSVTAEDDAFYDVVPAETSVVNQVDYEDNQSVEKEESALPVTTSFYTTLPSRQVAETFASLAAAGNINSNLVNSLQQPQQEKVQEETEEEYSEEDANSQIGRPEEEEYDDYSAEAQQNDQQQYQQRPYEHHYQQQHNQQQQQQLHQQQQQQRHQQQQQQQQRYQQYEQSQNTQHKHYETQENHDYEEEDNSEQQEVEEDVQSQQSKTTLQFGERIRPKRT